MTRGNFIKSGRSFEAEVSGIKIRINDSAMSDENVQLAANIIQAYPHRVTAIADHILQDEWIAAAYKLSKDEIIQKLHLPVIRIDKFGCMLSYCENEIDFDHILDIEFSGVLENFYQVGMDG